MSGIRALPPEWCVRIKAGPITRVISFMGDHASCEAIASTLVGQPLTVANGDGRSIVLGIITHSEIEPLELPRARGDLS
jgi:hypothetical protein